MGRRWPAGVRRAAGRRVHGRAGGCARRLRSHPLTDDGECLADRRRARPARRGRAEDAGARSDEDGGRNRGSQPRRGGAGPLRKGPDGDRRTESRDVEGVGGIGPSRVRSFLEEPSSFIRPTRERHEAALEGGRAVKRRMLSAGLLACLSVVWASASSSPEGLVVHEWGTFLSMSGSDGVSLEGMYHEEHALPPFVHARGTAQLKRPSSVVKGETPVIYFYTPERRRVHVEVGF